jgi:hypothetical protein
MPKIFDRLLKHAVSRAHTVNESLGTDWWSVRMLHWTCGGKLAPTSASYQE